MKPLAEDTPIEVERIQMEMVRQLTPAQKLARMAALNRSLKTIAREQFRSQFAEASEREFELRPAARWLDPELMRRAFGWDPRGGEWQEAACLTMYCL